MSDRLKITLYWIGQPNLKLVFLQHFAIEDVYKIWWPVLSVIGVIYSKSPLDPISCTFFGGSGMHLSHMARLEAGFVECAFLRTSIHKQDNRWTACTSCYSFVGCAKYMRALLGPASLGSGFGVVKKVVKVAELISRLKNEYELALERLTPEKEIQSTQL